MPEWYKIAIILTSKTISMGNRKNGSLPRERKESVPGCFASVDEGRCALGLEFFLGAGILSPRVLLSLEGY